MWPSRSRRGFRRQPNLGLLLLLMQLCQAGFDRIPPVTLGTIGFNVAVYLGLVHEFFGRRLPGAMQICASVVRVWKQKDYWRLAEASFHHADDWHLYYNMVSFLWKGMFLEKKIGSKRFFLMVGVFSVLVNIVMLYLNYAATYLFSDASYLSDCALGFSGVVFAVKVVTTQMTPPGTSMIMGFIPVNSRLSCWFELVLIQVMIPNASFTGHLAGILVGLAYVKGPLKKIMDWPFSGERRRYFNGPSYTYYQGTASSAQRTRGADYDAYTGGMDEDEQMRRAMERSMRDEPRANHDRLYPDLSSEMNGRAEPSAPLDPDQPAPYGWNIPNQPPDEVNDANHPRSSFDAEEVRRRRLERYSRRT